VYGYSVRIVSDPPKRLKNLEERGLDFDDLTVEFFETAVIYPAKGGRVMAINMFEGHVHTVISKRLGREAISVISMLRASKKERTRHKERTSYEESQSD
jgi:uncharacterized protein